MVTTYALASVASSACADRVFPAVLVDAQGAPLPVDRTSSGGGVHVEGPPRVDPGDLVTGTASWAVVRGATNPPTDLVILPDSLTRAPRSRPPLAVSLAGVAVPPDPRDPVTGDGTPWRSTAAGGEVRVSRPGSLASLTAVVTAPGSVRLGERLTYTVALRNPSTVPVSLLGCPEILELLSVTPQKVAVSSGYRGPLNCAGAPPSIEPQGSVVLTMELPTDGLVTGSGGLTWQLVTDGSAVSQARADVTVLP